VSRIASRASRAPPRGPPAGAVGSAVQAFAVSVSDEDFALFQALINREAGIWLSPVKKALLAGRLSRRLRELGIASFGAYYELVTSDANERVRMLDALATNETHFFREPRHWEYLADRHLPALKAQADAGRRPRRLRAWSAACSTGEEPYSIAMTLLAAFPAGWDLEVIASDLSTKALDKAQRATWPIAKSEEIPPDYLKAFMLRGHGEQAGLMRAGPQARALCSFSRLNLVEAVAPAIGSFDLVFCRNVLIYFDRDSRAKVIGRLIERLAPGGLLFVGHAETLTSFTTLVRPVLPTIYQRAGDPPLGRDGAP
jgi:chemotaxis protein methyltransferase CheR